MSEFDTEDLMTAYLKGKSDAERDLKGINCRLFTWSEIQSALNTGNVIRHVDDGTRDLSLFFDAVHRNLNKITG